MNNRCLTDRVLPARIVAGHLRRQGQLGGLVVEPGVSVATEQVTERDIAAPLLTVVRNDMQVSDSFARATLEDKDVPAFIACVSAIDPAR